jgi:mobilome CxxCx(11)CxxC protein
MKRLRISFSIFSLYYWQAYFKIVHCLIIYIMLSSAQGYGTKKKASLLLNTGNKAIIHNFVKPSNSLDKHGLLNELNKSLVYSLATKYIFDQRIVKYTRRMTVLAVLGVITPLLLGGILLSFDIPPIAQKIIKAFAASISLLQLILSVWALLAKWEYILSYSQEASYAHWVLFNKYKNLFAYPPDSADELKNEIGKIEIEQMSRDQQDAKIPPSPKDLRAGMRYSLFILHKPCAACKEIPTSMTSTNCDVCGNLNPKYKFIPSWLRL